MGIATPLNSDWVGPADVRDDDGGTNITNKKDRLKSSQASEVKENLPRPITLNPAILSENETMELFAEVLDHVVAFGFAMDQQIDTDFLLEPNDSFDFLRDELFVRSFSNFPLA